MEFFSREFKAAIQNGVVHPYICPGGPPPMQHLLYADDMVVFSNGRKNSVRKLVDIIQSFWSTSGQMLNPDKSCIFFSTSIKETHRTSLLELTGFKSGIFPTTNLGALLFPGRPKIEYFKHLEECIKTKISGWTKRFLSISGRATIIASVLGSLIIHTMSIIPVPKGCLQKMERLLANFLWDSGEARRRHSISWDTVCVPKDEGLEVTLPQEAKDWRVRDVASDPLIRTWLLSMLPGSLSDVVNNISLGVGPDKLRWKGCSSGTFTVWKYYLNHRRTLPKQRLFDNIWQVWIPPKSSGLVWKRFHKVIPIDDSVKRLGFQLPSKCHYCKVSACETMDHLFCQSDIAKAGWEFLAKLFYKTVPHNIIQLKYY
ncbi:hypothetical protein QQ045_033260 [Rhodiola kirilowii]